MRAVFTMMTVVMMALGCSSTATHSIIARQMADIGSVIEEARAYTEIGPVEARRCRYFFVNVFPWGDSTTVAAMEKALRGTGGNAILNASVTTSLYGFFPIYNVLSFTCTTVKGIAVRIETESSSSTSR